MAPAAAGTARVAGRRARRATAGRFVLIVNVRWEVGSLEWRNTQTTRKWVGDLKAMGRSLKKGPHVDERLLEKVYRADSTGNREPIRTWARACTIVPEFVGKRFAIHNGRTFLQLYVTEDMVGHKLGEFAPTRTFKGHGGKASKASAGKKG